MRTPPTRYDTYECTRVHAYTQRVCWYIAYDATMVFIVIRVCVCVDPLAGAFPGYGREIAQMHVLSWLHACSPRLLYPRWIDR